MSSKVGVGGGLLHAGYVYVEGHGRSSPLGTRKGDDGLKEGGKEFFGWHEEGGRVCEETGPARETMRSVQIQVVMHAASINFEEVQ